MKLNLNDEKVQETIYKNTATSYGLTLVIGLPFAAEINSQIQHIQEQLETVAPGRFTWYGLPHLHATLVAPLRGQYRDLQPLQRAKLPADLQGFTSALVNFFVQHQPFTIELAGTGITTEGLVAVGEKTLEQELVSCLQKYPEFDRPKHIRGFHVSIGFLNTSRPFATDEEWTHFETTLDQLTDIPIGRMIVEHVWLVHYANRTLDRIVGKVPFTLGRANVITVERLLQELGIAATPFVSNS